MPRIMITREQWTRFIDHPVVEWSIFVVGVILMLLSPLAGVIPGPGGIFVFAIGLAMVLKTSMWAKRHYVRFKNWQPKAAAGSTGACAAGAPSAANAAQAARGNRMPAAARRAGGRPNRPRRSRTAAHDPARTGRGDAKRERAN